MKLIVGLGNPGKEYDWTRHNIGYGLLDFIAYYYNVKFDKVKFNASYVELNINSEKVILVKPLSFMNLSGGVVKNFFDYYKLTLSDLLVIQDDLDMNFGRVKIVYNSSSGGHNGIKDIEKYLKSKEYARLKIGISNDKNVDTRDYVLSRFNDVQKKELLLIYNELRDIVNDFCVMSLDKLMCKYNNKNR